MRMEMTQVVGGWHARDTAVGLTYFGQTEAEAVKRLRQGVRLLAELGSVSDHEDKPITKPEAVL
jgi:hypothetical protein